MSGVIAIDMRIPLNGHAVNDRRGPIVSFNGREGNLVLIVHGLEKCVFQDSLVVELILCISSNINLSSSGISTAQSVVQGY